MRILITTILAGALALSVGCATQKTTSGGTPPPPKLSPTKVAALEGIACKLGKDLIPNLSAADVTRITNSCNALQTATANWQSGVGTQTEVLNAANDALNIWTSINLGSASLNAKIDEIVVAFEAIVVIVSP
jgi:hypothetical protein